MKQTDDSLNPKSEKTTDSHKNPFNEMKSKNLMDWGVLDFAESVKNKETGND